MQIANWRSPGQQFVVQQFVVQALACFGDLGTPMTPGTASRRHYKPIPARSAGFSLFAGPGNDDDSTNSLKAALRTQPRLECFSLSPVCSAGFSLFCEPGNAEDSTNSLKAALQTALQTQAA